MKRFASRAWPFFVLGGLIGCRTGSPDTFEGAATMSAVALGAAIAERKTGGCIALCTGDTICNPRNGLCEVLPCRNECGDGQHCEETPTGAHCADGALTGVTARARGSGISPYIAPPVPPPPPGSPTVVPAAEQQSK